MNDFAESSLALALQRARAKRHHERRNALRAWWARLWMDKRTAYLAQSNDLCELEQRMRRWDQREHEAQRWLR
jgi:Protein of unknown function (DUF3563)